MRKTQRGIPTALCGFCTDGLRTWTDLKFSKKKKNAQKNRTGATPIAINDSVKMASTPSAAFRRDRVKLFDDSTAGVNRRRRKPTGSSTANEAAAIQQSLGRTQSLLRSELERVSNVASAIEGDGKLLNKTMDAHETMDVSKAKKALTSLQRAQQREQRILVASILFFWTVVFYILWCRILIRVPYLDRVLVLLNNVREQVLLLFDNINNSYQ